MLLLNLYHCSEFYVLNIGSMHSMHYSMYKGN